MTLTREDERLEELRQGKAAWDRWGTYLSARQWGTVREDYSANGTAWEYFPFDHARLRAYRWGEDGLAGFSDWHQHVCVGIALWNGRDPILKERLFGLTNSEGNHGEDVKEYYFYVDATPTFSYAKCVYKYPHAEYPYSWLREENKRRSRQDPEFELMDTGIFRQSRYFDVFVEYAKAAPDDILIRITAWNRGPESAQLCLLPVVWCRNTWSWGRDNSRPKLVRENAPAGMAAVSITHPLAGCYWLAAEGSPELLFTENETNYPELFGVAGPGLYTKDGIDRFIVRGESGAVNPAGEGTKAAAHYKSDIPAGGNLTARLRLRNAEGAPGPAPDTFGAGFDQIFEERIGEADEFYHQRVCKRRGASADAYSVQRQAFAGLLWNKQAYQYNVRIWLEGDPGQPPPPEERKHGRNSKWLHLNNADVISMPDKWEYPWYAAWDSAFHCVALALVEPEFAKKQLLLFMREWYMDPNGQIPAYEWAFGDANPPLHAWAAMRVYQIERRICGKGDRDFLERAFHKLLLNFTWWVNRKDIGDLNVFQGGFLGLDNIGVFDRSRPLPGGGVIEQSDGTSWMAIYCLTMLAIALELAKEDHAYEDVASKFFEHFIYIADAMNDMGGQGVGLWDDADGFYYDALHLPNGHSFLMKVRSAVGLIPAFAVWTMEPDDLSAYPGFRSRAEWFLKHHAGTREHLDISQKSPAGARSLVSMVNRQKLVRLLRYVLDENEFLSPYGLRSLSKYHEKHPYVLNVNGETRRVDYEPAESTSGDFGGNSNWRGPVWFPLNIMLIEALQRYDWYYGESLKVECPTGSGNMMRLWDVAGELSRRLTRIFLRRDGRRAVYGADETMQNDPYWRDYVLFYEYFHGDKGAGLGASHQTGWTAMVAKLIEQSGE